MLFIKMIIQNSDNFHLHLRIIKTDKVHTIVSTKKRFTKAKPISYIHVNMKYWTDRFDLNIK